MRLLSDSIVEANISFTHPFKIQLWKQFRPFKLYGIFVQCRTLFAKTILALAIGITMLFSLGKVSMPNGKDFVVLFITALIQDDTIYVALTKLE